MSGYHGKSELRVTGAGSGVEAWMVSVHRCRRGDPARRGRTSPGGEKIPVTTHHEEGDPGKAIITVAKEVEADLVVVGNRGMKGLKRFVLGSVPNDVAHGAPCAVLILKTT